MRKVADGLRARFARAAAPLLQEAAKDILARIVICRPSTSASYRIRLPLGERLNKQIKRRSNVVGIFPAPQSVLRLVAALLLEQDDECAVPERRYFSGESMK